MSDSDYYEQRGELQIQDIDPVPVHIASSSAKTTRDAAPEFGNCMTWQIDTFANMGKETEILSRRYRRDEARILVQALAPVGAPVNLSGTATSPGANQNLLTMGLANLTPGATYLLQWNVGLSGTVSATDTNNFQIIGPGFNTMTSDNPGAAGGPWQQNQVEFTVPIGNATTLRVRSIAAGTVGAVYFAQATITPVGATGAQGAQLVLNSRREAVQAATPQGLIIVSAPTTVKWKSQRPCFAVLTPGSIVGPITVCTIDETYEEV